MFTNRGWVYKFAVPVVLFAGLCLDSLLRVGERHPSVKRCLSAPERYDGREIWVETRPVSEVHADGFSMADPGGRLHVLSSERPGTGTWVSVKGVFRKPDRLEATRVLSRPYFVSQRSGAYGISTLVILVWAWFFLKRFKLGLRGGLLHPRESRIQNPESGTEDAAMKT